MPLRTRFFLALLPLLLTACDSMLPGSISKDAATTPPPPFDATIEAIQENVFTPICFECHSGSHPSGGMSLADAQTSYDNLVNVPTNEARSAMLNRVTPGKPDDSYIIHKLEGTQEAGSQMPDGCPRSQPCLDADTIAVIRQWIADGAMPPKPPDDPAKP